MIKVTGLHKEYGTQTVLDGASFTLGRGQRAALVGPNGTGKTTLLRILAGEESPDGGVVDIPSNACVGYLPQDTSVTTNETVEEYLRENIGLKKIETRLSANPEDSSALEAYERLNGFTFTPRVNTMVAGFGLEDVSLSRSMAELSSGQKSKIVLISILLKGADLLLLDEPTNNLDIPALIWLEDYLMRAGVTCLIVSHDRVFLDRVAQKIFDLDPLKRTLTVVNGSYTEYLRMKALRHERHKQEYVAQQEELDRLTVLAEKKRSDAQSGASWKGSDNDKFLRGFKQNRAGKSGRVAKAIEKRIERMEPIERPVDRAPLQMKISSGEGHGNMEISLDKVVAGYASGSLSLGPLSFRVSYGSHVGIVGFNGSGKSTLLKTMGGILPPLSGQVLIGSGLRMGDLMQEHDSLPRDVSPLDYFHTTLEIPEQNTFALLKTYGLDERAIRNPIAQLSPGMRTRMTLAASDARSVNVLLLDEPTNHLDLDALDALEEALLSYTGTIILVSHDRALLEKLKIDRLYQIADGSIVPISNLQSYLKDAEQRARRLLHRL